MCPLRTFQNEVKNALKIDSKYPWRIYGENERFMA